MPLDADVKAKIDGEVAKAMQELRDLYAKGEPTGTQVVLWFAKWKQTATYKYLGTALAEFARTIK